MIGAFVKWLVACRTKQGGKASYGTGAGYADEADGPARGSGNGTDGIVGVHRSNILFMEPQSE